MTGSPLRLKPDFERARRYWDAFWHRDIVDRPCTVVWARAPGAYPEAPRTVAIDADFGDVLARHDRFLATHAFLGECMPGFRPGFGPDQFAGFLGAPLIMGDETVGTSWSQKIVESWNDTLPLALDESGPCWKRMHEFHRAAEAHCAGRCLLYNIDLHSNLDALEGLRGAERLLLDLMDTPDLVMRALDQVRSLHRLAYDAFYGYGSKESLGTCSWLHMYARGRYSVIQSDFIALLSPDLFRAFALPALREETECFDACCFHLDGPGALVHLPEILALPRIQAIQWLPGAGNRRQLEWVELLTRIQTAGKSVILYGSPDEIRVFHGTLRPELLVYEVQAASVEEGERLLDWLRAHT